MKIKYHDNTIQGNQYGEDGYLLDNWNPDGDYKENEYVNVHFRIDTHKFSDMYGHFDNDNNREEFTKEKVAVFESLGWEIESPQYCMTITKGKSELYLHPHDFSGIMLKREIKEVAEAIAKAKTFTIRWVDVYKTVYDMSDSDYSSYLKTKRNETRKLLFNMCKTSRRNKYCYRYEATRKIAVMIQLPRIGCRSVYDPNPMALEYVNSVIDEMESEGYLFTAEYNGNEYVRTANKTELKQRKLEEVA